MRTGDLYGPADFLLFISPKLAIRFYSIGFDKDDKIILRSYSKYDKITDLGWKLWK